MRRAHGAPYGPKRRFGRTPLILLARTSRTVQDTSDYLMRHPFTVPCSLLKKGDI